MTKKFKSGDKVYHRHLKQFGTFVQYNTLSDDECYVDFVNEDGYTECKIVSVSQLQIESEE